MDLFGKKEVKPVLLQETGIPKKKSVILLYILNAITFMIYGSFWYLKRVPELNNLKTPTKMKKTLPVVNLVFIILSFLSLIVVAVIAQISNIPNGTIDINQVPIGFTISFILTFVFLFFSLILFLIMGFKVRKILNEALINKGEKVKLSGFFTFFFNFLYLQYEINRIIDDKENQKRVGPWVWFVILYLIPIISAIIIFIFVVILGYSLLALSS